MSIFNQGTIKHLKRGSVLLQPGEVCKFGCEVIKGCLKSYVLDPSGKEHIMQFAPEGWLITDMDSLIHQVPAIIYIEAVEDCEVFWIDGQPSQDMWKNMPKEVLEQQITLLTRNIIAANKRTRLLLSSTGEERYLDFLHTYPTLALRLPLKLIASYIGITPEYLSEIRRKLVHK